MPQWESERAAIWHTQSRSRGKTMSAVKHRQSKAKAGESSLDHRFAELLGLLIFAAQAPGLLLPQLRTHAQQKVGTQGQDREPGAPATVHKPHGSHSISLLDSDQRTHSDSHTRRGTTDHEAVAVIVSVRGRTAAFLYVFLNSSKAALRSCSSLASSSSAPDHEQRTHSKRKKRSGA